MAGLFEEQDVGGISGGVQPQQAVAPAPSMLQTVSGSNVLGGLGGLIGGFMQGADAAKKQQAQDAQNAVVTGYARKITQLDAAVSQGTKSQSAAKREQRAYFNQLIANNPALTEQLVGLNTKLAASQGLGDTLAQGTAVDQQIQADTKAATAAGFINPGMTPEQQDSGLNAFRAQQHQLNQMEFYSKQLGITQQKLSIQASQESIAASRTSRANAAMDLQLKRQKLRVQQATADISTSYFDKTRVQLDNLNQQVAQGLPPDQALQQLEKMKADFSTLTMPIRGVAGADYVDAMSKPIMDAIEAQKDFVSGKITKDVYQNKLDLSNVKSNLEIMSDPQLAKIMNISKLTGNLFDNKIMASFGDKVVDYVRRGIEPGANAGNMSPDNPQEQAQTKTYLNTLRDVTKNLGNKDPRIVDPKETFSEVVAHANQVLQGVSDFSSAQKQPSQLNSVVDYLASPEFLALQQMGGKLNQDSVEGAKNAVSVNYNDKLIPAVRDEWMKSKTVLGAPTGVKQIGRVSIPVQPTGNTTDAVTYTWTGSSIQFKPAPGLERNVQVQAKARELQKSLAPLINKSVRMSAHLDGSQEYTKYFQQNEQAFFGENPSDVTEVGQ
jgi:hypothetical protein